MALPTGYMPPKDFAEKLKNPMMALDMAEQANDLTRVLAKGMNIHLMAPEGRITVRHTAEALKEAHQAREAMRQLTGGQHVVDASTSARVYDGRTPEASPTVRGA